MGRDAHTGRVWLVSWELLATHWCVEVVAESEYDKVWTPYVLRLRPVVYAVTGLGLALNRSNMISTTVVQQEDWLSKQYWDWMNVRYIDKLNLLLVRQYYQTRVIA